VLQCSVDNVVYVTGLLGLLAAEQVSLPCVRNLIIGCSWAGSSRQCLNAVMCMVVLLLLLLLLKSGCTSVHGNEAWCTQLSVC
jgi:hypothetical protein